MAAVAAVQQKNPFHDAEDQLKHMDRTLTRIGEEVVLPAFARNYDSSGLKKRSGVAKDALTKRGARGNVFIVRGNTLTAGGDPEVVKHLKWIIKGRGPVVARRGKMLRFDIDGRILFRKRVKAAPAHDVVYLTGDDMRKANTIVGEEMGKDWRARV